MKAVFIVHNPALTGRPGSSSAPTPAARKKDPAARPVRTLEEPTPADMARNFAGAVASWSAAGFPTVDRAVYNARSTACEACEMWDGKARLGLGKCNAPGCGCTSLKRWLATERCPLGRWPAAAS